MKILPTNPKPHINTQKLPKPKRNFDYNKAVEELVTLAIENKKIIDKYTRSPNEAVYR